MAATEDEYTLDDALSDLWSAGKEMDHSGGRAETWIRGRIAELECQTASPDRLAALEEQQRNFAYWTVAMDGRLRVLEEQLRDAQSLLNEADTKAPEQTYVQNPLCCAPFAAFSGMVHCGKPAGHTDGHAALNEHHHVTVWGRPEQYNADVTSATAKPAPTHLSEGRLAQDGEEQCTGTAFRSPEPGSQAVRCARERWHTGPHMDATAIAHAGKAGEVWG